MKVKKSFMLKMVFILMGIITVSRAYSDVSSGNDRLQFNIIAEKTTYKVGQPFSVKLEFVNISKKSVGLYINTDSVGISIYDMSGEKITAQNCDLDGMVMAVLGPNEKYDERTVDIKDRLPVLKGQYSIQMTYASNSDVSKQGFQLTNKGNWNGNVDSNKVTIDVEE